MKSDIGLAPVGDYLCLAVVLFYHLELCTVPSIVLARKPLRPRRAL
jgi:hypothetical protein